MLCWSTGPFGDADRSWSQSHTHIHKVRDVRAYSLGGDVEERGLGLGEDELALELPVVCLILYVWMDMNGISKPPAQHHTHCRPTTNFPTTTKHPPPVRPAARHLQLAFHLALLQHQRRALLQLPLPLLGAALCQLVLDARGLLLLLLCFLGGRGCGVY